MEYPERTHETYLDEWRLDESGQLEKQPLQLVSELVSPRPMVYYRQQRLALPHTLGTTVDWSEQPLHQSLIFKEVVEGPYVLAFLLVQEDQELIGRDGRDSKRGSQSKTSRSFAQRIAAAQQLENPRAELPELSGVVGFGYLELHSSDSVIDEVRRVELEAPTPIRNPEPDPAPERHTDYDEFLKQPGADNGYIDVRLRVMDR